MLELKRALKTHNEFGSPLLEMVFENDGDIFRQTAMISGCAKATRNDLSDEAQWQVASCIRRASRDAGLDFSDCLASIMSSRSELVDSAVEILIANA